MMLDTTDTRTLKAIQIAAARCRRRRGRLHDGTKFYVVPSESNPERVYWTNLRDCTCPDSQRGNVCKHRRAVALHVARVKAQQGRRPKPAPVAPVNLDAARQKRLAARYAALYGQDAA
jgi:hypothetical protein